MQICDNINSTLCVHDKKLVQALYNRSTYNVERVLAMFGKLSFNTFFKTLIYYTKGSIFLTLFNPSDFLKKRSVVPTDFLCKLPLDVYTRHDFFSQLSFDVYTSLLIKYLLDFGSSEKFIWNIFGC